MLSPLLRVVTLLLPELFSKVGSVLDSRTPHTDISSTGNLTKHSIRIKPSTINAKARPIFSDFVSFSSSGKLYSPICCIHLVIHKCLVKSLSLQFVCHFF